MFGGRTLAVISGASRGVGRELALSLAARCGEDSSMLLIARDAAALGAVRCEVEQSRGAAVAVSVYACDLATVEHSVLEAAVRAAVGSGASFDTALLVQNAGSLGPIERRSCELTDAPQVRRYLDANFTSFVLLNSAFLGVCSPAVAPRRVVVNVSSGAAYASTAGFQLYGAAKAARDAFYRFVAAEEPNVRVLSFNPGPVRTDMQREVGDKSWCVAVKQWSNDGMRTSEEGGTFLEAKVAADELLAILEEDTFESGGWLDVHRKKMQFIRS